MHVILNVLLFLSGLGFGSLYGFGAADAGPGILLGIILGFAFALVYELYMLPYVIAHKRALKNQAIIFLVNLIFGGTGVVWVICLIFSFSGDKIAIKNTET
ncbi:MAG: superinfection immunity protein [Planctomycetes bacterium]|nr:superinfection immunity protein [Planctomycetota bacterium]